MNQIAYVIAVILARGLAAIIRSSDAILSYDKNDRVSSCLQSYEQAMRFNRIMKMIMYRPGYESSDVILSYDDNDRV
jgi:hypothetical protein